MSSILQKQHITVAVTGGIAAYKACEVVRGLMKKGADVRVAMTENAARFVGPITFEALTGRPVALTEWHTAGSDIGAIAHIDITRSADLLLVMPATANILAKAANGIADDLVSALICARRAPVVFAPAMNVNMWKNPATQKNVETLRKHGCGFIGPAEGYQACGDVGAGRMSEPAEIVERVEAFFAPKVLAGRRIVVTAGPTYEAIDPVRGITNRSSGRQGYAVARAAAQAGADVLLISGPTALSAPAGVNRVNVLSARDMLASVEEALDNAAAEGRPVDLFISVAAVADWRPAEAAKLKIKKPVGMSDAAASPLSAIAFEANPDILAAVGARPDAPMTIGFAAETASDDELIALAREKCLRKRAAFICANDARSALDSAANAVAIVTPTDHEIVGPADKEDCARAIVAAAAAALERVRPHAAEPNSFT